MSSWKGKTRGGLVGYQIFTAILNFFGLSIAYFILRFVVVYYYFFSGNSFKAIYDLWNKRIRKSKFVSYFKVYSNFYVFGQVLLDKIALLSGMKTNFTFDFDGEEHLHKMVADGNGGMLIGAHLGNWEIAGHLLKRINTKINIVMYDEEHQRIKQYLSHIYQETVVNIIPIKADLSHIFLINNAIKNNEFICLHGDRFLEGNQTIKLDFMGQEALFPSGSFLIAVKYSIPVSFVFAVKETNTHYHFMATPPKTYSASGSIKARQEAIKDIITAYKNNLEEKLKKYPEHWFNFYDFWEIKNNEQS
jgi:predicted LPLAT superfamily acyltransferase